MKNICILDKACIWELIRKKKREKENHPSLPQPQEIAAQEAEKMAEGVLMEEEIGEFHRRGVN